MIQRRKTELREINGVLNKPLTVAGIDFRLVGVALLLVVPIFLYGSKLLAFCLLPTLTGGGWLVTRKEPKMFVFWVLSFFVNSSYDPGK